MKKNQPKELLSFAHDRTAEIIGGDEFRDAVRAGRKLRVKLGIDANKPDLHIGHMVPLRLLQTFQEYGHTAVLIIGDFTARIGDPSGRSVERSLITAAQIKRNERTYFRQIGHVLDLKKAEVRHNSEWYLKMRLAEFLDLLAQFSLKSAWERDDFQKRLAVGKPVHLHEAMYSVLQAYDSVAIKADVELGGLDQKLNILAGRELQGKRGDRPQTVMLMPYLIGLDGSQKMSKSSGNSINLEDSASDMFGKAMSIPDTLIQNYAELAAWLPPRTAQDLIKRLERENPRDVKLDLAEAISALYHGPRKAEAARAGFVQTFSKRDRTGSAVKVRLAPARYHPLDLIRAIVPGISKSEARRLVRGGALEAGGRVRTMDGGDIEIRSGVIVRIGKKSFYRVD